MQARAIVDGDLEEFVERNAFTMAGSSRYLGPVAYPWGYPLALAPVVWLFDAKPLALKLVGLGFFLVFLAAAYILFERRLGPRDSTLLVAVLGTWPVLVGFNDQIVSDMPFLALSTLTLALLDRAYVMGGESEGSASHMVSLGMVLFAAVFVRTIGLLLLPTLLLVQLVQIVGRRRSGSGHLVAERQLKMAAIPHAVFLGLYVLAALSFPSSTVASYRDAIRFPEPGILLDNALYYVYLSAELFGPLPFEQVVFGVLLPFVLVGLVIHFKRDYHLAAYSSLTLVLLVLLPYQGGERYLFPLVPLLVYFAFAGMKSSALALAEVNPALGERLTYVFWSCVLAAFLVGSMTAAWQNLGRDRAKTWGPYTTVSQEMFDFIRRSTEGDAVIGFFKPRVMRLMTDRDAVYPKVSEGECPMDYYVHFEAAPRNYVRVQIPRRDLTAALAAAKLVEVWNNREFTVYHPTACSSRSRRRLRGPERVGSDD